MNPYELATTVNIGGKEYPIRSDFRAILDILIAMNDPSVKDNEKMWIMLVIFYPDIENMPKDKINEMLEKATEFINCGEQDDGSTKPKLIDWEQDAGIIIPAVNNVAHAEIRALPYVHWWTFWGWFMSIGESLLGNVLHIRQKNAEGAKLERWEEKYYKKNKHLIDFRTFVPTGSESSNAYFQKWL